MVGVIHAEEWAVLGRVGDCVAAVAGVVLSRHV